MDWHPETAMVLAAGLGNRMRPLTDAVPKPLVRLGGRPLIDYVLDRIADAGVARAVVNVHYRAQQLIEHLATRTRPQIAISDESGQLLDTGGGVKKALPQLGQGGFLIHNSDSVWIEPAGSNLSRLFGAWRAEQMDCLMLLARVETSIGYEGAGDFLLDVEGRIARRLQGLSAPFVFTGVSLAHPRLLAQTPDGKFSLNLPWDRAIAAGRAYGVVLEGTWMHVGDPMALAAAERLLDRGSSPTTLAR
jgi:MurNAc alpha-1-phosphate uridylyltransferase